MINLMHNNEGKIEVSVHLPWLPTVIQQRTIIHRENLEELIHLYPPKDIDLLPDTYRYAALAQWRADKERAKNVLNMISNDIALQLSSAISKKCRT